MYEWSGRPRQVGQWEENFNPTRWWSKWEVFHVIYICVVWRCGSFSATNRGITCNKLLQILADRSKSEFLQLELAAVIDAGEPFVKATYKLE